MRFYWDIAKIDAEQRTVWGYASTEAQDEQGEVVTREALSVALADYMKFANIREMHQLSAVGVATEAGVDQRGLYIAARVVDERAWEKIREGVYKGFSIGGRVKARDPANRSVITGLALTEISLVDRPANPETVFDCWKADGGDQRAEAPLEDDELVPREPIQVWDCGLSGHRHRAKAAAARCLARQSAGEADLRHLSGPGVHAADLAHADPGYCLDGEPRLPLDTERHIRAAWAYIHQPGTARPYTPAQFERIRLRIIAAWREKVDSSGPPSAAPDIATEDADAVRPSKAEPLAMAAAVANPALAGDAANVIAKALAENAALRKAMNEIAPRLDRLAARVEEIARMPLPAQTMARGALAVAKSDDGGAALSADEIAAGLARLSGEERTMALIKAAYANPIRPPLPVIRREPAGPQ